MNRTLPPPDRRSVRASVTLYRVLLLAYPAAFRRSYGAAMVQAFRDTCRQASTVRGLAGVLALWLPTLTDLVLTACAERLLEVRQRPRTQVVRLCGLLTLAGALLSLPLRLLQWWMLTLQFAPHIILGPCQLSCITHAGEVSGPGALALLFLNPLVALCLPCGLFGVLLLQQGRPARSLVCLALLGQVGVAGSSALGGDSYLTGLGQWLAPSMGALQGSLAFLLAGVGLLAYLVLPVLVLLCGGQTLNDHVLGAWSVALLLLGGAIFVKTFWWIPVSGVLPHLSISLELLIATGLALGESVLWAVLGYALWVRKDEPLVRAESLA